MLAPFVLVQAVGHAGHELRELLLEHGVELQARRRAIVRIGARLEVLGPQAVDHQRPLAARTALGLALVTIGAEGGMHGHCQQVEIECRGLRRLRGRGGRRRLVLPDIGQLTVRSKPCKQRAQHQDRENDLPLCVLTNSTRRIHVLNAIQASGRQLPHIKI